MQITIEVNGTPHTLEVAPNTLLVEVLREQLRLTGTHVGCDTSQCGACTVHMNGTSVKACTVVAPQADGASVVTIEGIGSAEELHPMQAAFRECHALQCGFCTPGMLLTAAELLARETTPSRERIREFLSGNYCRCTGYQAIVDAVEKTGKARGAGAGS